MSKESLPFLSLLPARKQDVRTQFGALCWRRNKSDIQVLLVTTRRTRRWVIPKGWPMGGETPAGAAAVEAFEEGGVKGVMSDNCLGIFTYNKEMEESDDLPCVVAVFPMRVTQQIADWPEASERKRQWLSPKKAASRVHEPELKRILREFDPRNL